MRRSLGTWTTLGVRHWVPTLGLLILTAAVGAAVSGCSLVHTAVSAPPCGAATGTAAPVQPLKAVLASAAASLPISLTVLGRTDPHPHCVTVSDRSIVLSIGDYFEFQDRSGGAHRGDPYLTPPTTQFSDPFASTTSSLPFDPNILRVTSRSAPPQTFGPAVCDQVVVRLTAERPGTGIIYFPSDCCGTGC